MELAYALTRDYGKAKALEVLRMVRAFVMIVQPTGKDYVEASALRIELKKQGKNLSLLTLLRTILALLNHVQDHPVVGYVHVSPPLPHMLN